MNVFALCLKSCVLKLHKTTSTRKKLTTGVMQNSWNVKSPSTNITSSPASEKSEGRRPVPQQRRQQTSSNFLIQENETVSELYFICESHSTKKSCATSRSRYDQVLRNSSSECESYVREFIASIFSTHFVILNTRLTRDTSDTHNNYNDLKNK